MTNPGEELLPCPFCGGEPHRPEFVCESGSKDIWEVGCRACDLTLEGPRASAHEAEAAAITKWNTRPQPLLSGDDGELVEMLRSLAGFGSKAVREAVGAAIDRILALNAEKAALSSRCGMLEGENENLASNLKTASEWLIKLVGEEPFRAALSADGEKL